VREDNTFPAKSPLTAARAALPGAVEPAAMSMSARSRTALSLVEPAKADGALAAAVDAFLSQPDLAVTTRAKYRQTLAVLEVELATAPVTGAAIGGVLAQRCRDAAPATWNRHLATVRSFARYCQRNGLLDIDGDIVLDRRAENHDQTRSIPLASLERPWERRDVALRERTLGRLLYETAARADEVLRLNVEDLDVPAKRARTRSKGGDVDWLFVPLEAAAKMRASFILLGPLLARFGRVIISNPGGDRIGRRMSRHHYALQALLYTVALHRFLRWRLSGYDPDTHLAGVAYLFVRGMTGEDWLGGSADSPGVFGWRVAETMA